MEIRTKKHFSEVIKSLTEEIIEEEDLDEITATANVDGYGTPYAFSDDKEKDKKKRKRYSTNSTGYNVVKESIDEKDLKVITKLIKVVVSDIIRDIWLKRNAWNK